ncbi:MAG: YdcF family protein [Actinomycetota bacterium]
MSPVRRLLRAAIRAAAALLAIAVVATGASALAVWRAAHTDDASVVPRADAILVLGAAQYDGAPSPVFEGRLDHALLLYDDDRAPLIVVLGGAGVGDATTEAEAGVAYLRDRGVPASALRASGEGSTTWESLAAVRPLLADLEVATVFLVSDPWHNLRVKRMARDLGIVGYATATWRSAARSEATRLDGYVRETLAYLAYRIVGR